MEYLLAVLLFSLQNPEVYVLSNLPMTQEVCEDASKTYNKRDGLMGFKANAYFYCIPKPKEKTK